MAGSASSQDQGGPWAIDPEHGMNKGPGYLGDAHHALRVREILKYYKPPGEEESHYVPPINTGEDFITEHPNLSPGLISSHDPILAAFANLTCRVIDARRCIVSMTAAGVSYVIAESTRTLSVSYPHTHAPGDQLFLGGGAATSSIDGLCEHTCSLLPPDPESNQPFLLEIPDLSKHPKFHDVGYVRGWPHGRFYCGAPMRTRNGVTIGTLCVMDDKPRYKGLTERERMELSHMADLFMRYLEAKQGEEERNKQRMMESELSRFITEGFLPGEGAMMMEKRDGKLLSGRTLAKRREKEMERRRKVEERRQMFQEQQYAAMVKRETRKLQRQQRKLENAPEMCQSDGEPGSTSEDEASEKDDEAVDPSKLVPVLAECQPGLIRLVPAHKLAEASQSGGRIEEVHHVKPPLFNLNDGIATSTDGMSDFSSSRPAASREGTANTISTLTTTTSAPDSFKAVPVPESTNTATSDASHIGASEVSKSRQLSRYEQTMALEPQFRAMFSRAAELIRNALDAEVLFVDADLEGVFEPAPLDDLRNENDGGWSFVSSDPVVESAMRAKRPAAQRTNSGILGYATSKGASKPGLVEEGRSRDLGFDVSQLSEQHLQRLAKENKGGKLLAFVDPYPGLEEPAPQPDFTEELLKRVLPGCKTVVILPLLDHHEKLFSMLFAWTCDSDRTFVSEVEGKFVQGVGESIMGEMTRLHILAADKAKAEFISSISHELRSPLHGILASADFLIESNLTYDQRSFVDTIVACGATLLDTVNNVLDFQKLESYSEIIGGSKPNLDGKTLDTLAEEAHSDHGNSSPVIDKYLQQETDLSALIQEVADGVCLGHEFKGLASGRSTTSDPSRHAVSVAHVEKIMVIMDIQHRQEGWRFLVNQSAVKRIVSNLVGNALKYSKECGWVKISLSVDSSPTLSKDGKKKFTVKLSVLDSGKGMTREFLKTKLFTPFSQENPLSAGAGLGLCIVRQLVELLGGKISIRSRLGEGTDVTVSMNLEEMDSDIPQDLERLSPERSKLRALFTGFDVPEHEHDLIKQSTAMLRKSTEECLSNFFGIDTIDEDTAIRDPEGVFIFCNGASDTTESVLAEVFALSNRVNGAPIVLLCNRSAYTKPHLDDIGSEDRLVQIRKPCGPRRLQNALAFCIDSMKANSKSCMEIPDIPALDTATTTAAVLDHAVGIQESVLSLPEQSVPLSPPDRKASVDLAFPAPANPAILSPPATDFSAMPRIPFLPFSGSVPKVRSSTHVDAVNTVQSTKELSKILCVEDNAVNMMLLTKFLKNRSYSFDTAVNGLEALERVTALAPSTYDVVLMDLQMPILSGVEATREIRRLEAENPERKRAFIVALTGLAAPRDREEAFEAGVDGFMVKPVSFAELDGILRGKVGGVGKDVGEDGCALRKVDTGVSEE